MHLVADFLTLWIWESFKLELHVWNNTFRMTIINLLRQEKLIEEHKNHSTDYQ